METRYSDAPWTIREVGHGLVAACHLRSSMGDSIVDLSYGAEYESFRQETRRFIEANAHLVPTGRDRNREKARAWQKLLIDNGYAARAIPKEYGGYGAELDILKSRIIAEEFARAQVSPGLGGQGIAYLVPTLLEMGTEELRKRFIPPRLGSGAAAMRVPGLARKFWMMIS